MVDLAALTGGLVQDVEYRSVGKFVLGGALPGRSRASDVRGGWRHGTAGALTYRALDVAAGTKRLERIVRKIVSATPLANRRSHVGGKGILQALAHILDPVFVGFSSKDIRSYHLMCAWKAHEHIEFNFADFQLNDAIDSENESYIKTKLRRKIVRSDVYALLIGTDTWQKTTFVKWEVEVAIETRRCSCPVRSRRRRLSCRGCTPAASRFAPARRPRPGSREEQRRGGSWPWCCSHLAKDAVRRRAYPMGDVPLWVSIWMTARVHARATLARASIRASRSEATPAVLGRSLRPSVPQRTEAR